MPGSGEAVWSLVLARLCAVLSPSTNPRPAWNAQKGRSGVHHAAEGNCRESLHPTPCPGIQFRTLWELEGTATLNTTPLLSSRLGILITAPIINAGNDFLSVKERYLSLILQSLGILCILCSLNVIRFFPLQLKCKPKKIKTSVDPSTDLVQCHGGPLMLIVGLLNSHFSPVIRRIHLIGTARGCDFILKHHQKKKKKR